MSQKVLCPSCDNEIDSENFVRKYFSKKTRVEYKLYHCKVCNLQFWFPLEFVKEIYEDELIRAYNLFHTKKMELFSRHIVFLREFGKLGLKGLKLLDIGCGNGSFLYEAQKFGFDVYGIDIDPKSVKFARDELGLKNVYNMSLDEFLEFNKEIKFDIITFFEVLEHQTDPKAFLQKLKNISNDSTIVVGTVPDRKRIFAELTRKGTSDYDFPPHHFMWFDKKSLRNLLVRSGLDPIVLKTIVIIWREIIETIFHYIYDKTKIQFFNIDSMDHLNFAQKLFYWIFFISSAPFRPFYRQLFFVCSIPNNK